MNFTAKKLFSVFTSKLAVRAQDCRRQPLKCFLVTGIVLVTISKLFLIGEGALAFSDEFRHRYSLMVAYDLANLNFKDAVSYIFSAMGRPLYVLIDMIPALLQFLTAKIFHLDVYESDNSYPLFIFNFIIYCCILIIHYKFSKRVVKDQSLALFSVLLFATLTNSYLYLRHAFPYDAGLLILYVVLYKTVICTSRGALSFRRSLFLGMVSSFGYLTYPGYFPLVIIIGLLLFLYKLERKEIVKKIKYLFCFVCGALLCLFATEALSRVGEYSYIKVAVSMSDAINMGSFDESFSFLIKYLFEVERLSGIIVLICLLIFYVVVIKHMIQKRGGIHSLIIVLAIIVTAIFLFYAGTGYFFHKMIFYGRLLHQYFPLICIFSVYAIAALTGKKLGKSIWIVMLSLILFVNYGYNFLDYRSYAYPRDIAWNLSKKYQPVQVANIAEYQDIYHGSGSEMNHVFFLAENTADSLSKDVIVTNAYLYHYFDDINKYHLFDPGNDYKRIASKPYFLNCKAYQYEGAGMEQRSIIDEINLHIRIYSRVDTTHQ
ncbi:MAG TPA: hypothetical protein PKW80_14415 [Bacteroidales bacterium]|nr:hypothetical protein [Bacteroidales bacterium]